MWLLPIFYLDTQIADLILCVTQPTVYSFQCMLYFNYCVLHFRLILFLWIPTHLG